MVIRYRRHRIYVLNSDRFGGYIFSVYHNDKRLVERSEPYTNEQDAIDAAKKIVDTKVDKEVQ